MEELEKQFHERFPEYSKPYMACHCDNTISGCVWDENRPEDCCYAKKGIKKDDCDWWRETNPEPLLYGPKEIFDWIKKSFTPQYQPATIRSLEKKMKKANDVLNQIEELYTTNGSYYINHQDIQKHLRSNQVDVDIASVHKYDSFETSFDESMSVLFYSDNSALVVNSSGIHAIG